MSDSSTLLEPGKIIGIVGGGQLGRMMAMAAAQLGYKTHIYCPDKDCPAAEVSTYQTVGEYEDKMALVGFAQEVDVITVEFENISCDGLRQVLDIVPVRPAPKLVETCQHRIREKTFINSLGIATAPFTEIRSEEDLVHAAHTIGVPGVLKTASMGYDGKGQVKLTAQAQLYDAWENLRAEEAVYEGFIDFKREISVIVARNSLGEITCYPPVENIHRNHILHQTIYPGEINDAVANKAIAIATKLAEGLMLEGILAVELFVTKEDEIVVNELAPRPHNSGHWTMDACAVSQFEQVIRAVCNLPLGKTTPHSAALMTNLIGDEVEQWRAALKEQNCCVHLYGKKEVRPGRKMGHITKLHTNTQ